MGLLGGLFNKHTDENIGNDNLAISDIYTGRSDANLDRVGGVQNFLQGQMGQGDFYSQAAQQGLGAFGQGQQQDAAAAGMQSSFAKQLQDQANGVGGPSLAQLQLQQGLQQNQAQAAGAMASQRGINPALAARLVGNQQAAAGQQAAGQSAMLRQQEMMNAQGMLGNVLAQQRQGAQGQMGMGQGLFGTGGQLQQQNLGQYANLFNNMNQNELARNAQSINQNQFGSNLALQVQQQRLNQAEGNASRKTQVAVGNTQGDNATGGAIINAAGSALSLAHGGAVPDVGQPSPTGNMVSFAELVAHHLTRHSQVPHLAQGGPMPDAGSPDAIAQAGGEPWMDDAGSGAGAGKMGHNPWSNFAKLTARIPGQVEGQLADNMAKGGAVKPYSFPAMDLRPDAATSGTTAAQPGQEGTDSEGKKKVLKLADGGAADDAGSASPGGFAGYMQKLGEKFSNIPSNIANKFNNGMVGQMFHPGVYSGGGGSMGPAVTVGTSNSMGAAGLLPSPTSMQPTGSLMGSTPVMAGGGRVPGVPAHPDQDTEKDDVQPALLSPGEVVLPKTIANSPSKAASFVQKLINDGEIHPAIVNWRHGKRSK